MKNFNYYSNLYNSDKGDIFPKGNNYAHWYENWFSPIRETVTNILEIGVWEGASGKAFVDYFPNSQIIGFDIMDTTRYNTERIKNRILNQGSPKQLDNFVNECKSKDLQFDIILDDGSHQVNHQQLTFGKLFSLVKPGGLYIIEDLCFSYFQIGYHTQTEETFNHNTVKFLTERPFNSPWILSSDLDYINKNIDYVSIYDRLNKNNIATYTTYKCVNDYPVRSITSIIKKI